MLRERKQSPKLYWKKMNQHGHHCGIKIVHFGRFIFPSVFRFLLDLASLLLSGFCWGSCEYITVRQLKNHRAMSGHTLRRMTGSGR